jgi:type IV secretory pathway TraG/TraD family ATPase VirD4
MHPSVSAATPALQPPPPGAVLHSTLMLLLMLGVVTSAIIVGRIVGRASPWRYLTAPLLAIPVLLGGAAVGGILGLFLPSIVANVVCVVLTLGFGFALGAAPPREDARHHRGAVVESGSPARAARRRPRIDGQLTLAGIPVPPPDEIKHFKLIGTTGTGKSTAIRELLQVVLARGDRAVVADPDGGYLARFYNPDRGDLLLNPFDARSRKWDLFAEIKNLYDFEQLARSLIPEGAGEDRNFRQYAQVFLTAVTRQMHGSGICDSAELYRLLASAPLEELRFLLEGTPAQPFVAAGNEKMFGSVRSVTTSAVAALGFINSQQGELLSIRQWVEQGRGVLFLPYRADQIAALRSMISTWMRIAIFETMTLPEGDARLWFIVDELDALGAIDGLKDALARLRKFGGRCVLGFQSIAQVWNTYGRGDAETIVENCGNTLILRCSASEGGGTARFASQLIGEREVLREQITKGSSGGWFTAHTRSESRTTQHATESAVLASEIEQLPDLHGYLKCASTPMLGRVRLTVDDRHVAK